MQTRPPKRNGTERALGVLSLVLVFAAGAWTVVDPDKWGLLSIVTFGLALNFLAEFSYLRQLGKPWAVPYFSFFVLLLVALLQVFLVGLDRSLVWLMILVVVAMLASVTLSLPIWRQLRLRRTDEHPAASIS